MYIVYLLQPEEQSHEIIGPISQIAQEKNYAVPILFLTGRQTDIYFELQSSFATGKLLKTYYLAYLLETG